MCKLIFPFGRYSGQTVDHVVETDPQYLLVILGRSWFASGWPMLAAEAARSLRKKLFPDQQGRAL